MDMQVEERFLKYVAFPTMSDGKSTSTPSTAKQLKLADALVEELQALGLTNAHRTQTGYVYATLPANCDKQVDTIGFIAHMDTSDACSDANIRPRIVTYEGGDIVLNAEKGIVLRHADFPHMDKYRGHHLIVTDGTTLLGGDDKAGIAEIVAAVAELIESGAPHGTIQIGFTPDEEIGRGTDHFDVEAFGADYAYTVDGGPFDLIEYENFNAAAATVRFHGWSTHPGGAKRGKMKNAAAIACRFQNLLPADEVPEKTEGYEGFYHLCGMHGGVVDAELEYIIRDHDRTKFEAKKRHLQEIAEQLNAEYGAGTVELEMQDSYYNMKEMLADHMYIVARAEAAIRALGGTPGSVAIRGGTDGARLSYMGLPCPNIGSGGENGHSCFEFISIEEMRRCKDLIVRICTDLCRE